MVETRLKNFVSDHAAHNPGQNDNAMTTQAAMDGLPHILDLFAQITFGAELRKKNHFSLASFQQVSAVFEL